MNRRRPFALLLAAAVAAAGCTAHPGSPPRAIDEAAAPAAPGPAAGAHQVRGTAPRAANNGVVIVTLTPEPAREWPAPTDEPRMDQVNLTFVPPVLLVRTGQPVLFLNNDDVLHNVRVREEATREGAFNVAIPTGGSYTFSFPRDGFYIVGCDIHPGMAAAVFAASTPYAVVADADASFRFPDVEPGSYILSVFSGVDTFTQPIQVAEPVTDVAVTRSAPSGTSQ